LPSSYSICRRFNLFAGTRSSIRAAMSHIWTSPSTSRCAARPFSTRSTWSSPAWASASSPYSCSTCHRIVAKRWVRGYPKVGRNIWGREMNHWLYYSQLVPWWDYIWERYTAFLGHLCLRTRLLYILYIWGLIIPNSFFWTNKFEPFNNLKIIKRKS